MAGQIFLHGLTKSVLPCAREARLQLLSINARSSNSYRLLCSQKPNEIKVSEKISSNVDLPNDKENPEISEFMKEIHKLDSRPPLKYRRQNYPDPIRRAMGILYDDVSILFYNCYYVIRGVCRITIGLDPNSGKSFHDTSEVNGGVSKETNHQEALSSKDENSVKKIETISIDNTIPVKADKVAKNPFTQKSTKEEGRVKKLITSLTPPVKEAIWPGHCDVLVIGGGAVGSSIAYHLKENGTDGVNVVVLEKDPTVSL